jgi:Holliday junction resolvase RusA-like endonuclease
MFRNVQGKGRVRTQDYKDWALSARWQIQLAKQTPIAGPVVAFLSVDRVNLCADIDNRVKAILDAIVKAGLIDDDSAVLTVVPVWTKPDNFKHPEARVLIAPAQSLSAKFTVTPGGKFGAWHVDLTEANEWR